MDPRDVAKLVTIVENSQLKQNRDRYNILV